MFRINEPFFGYQRGGYTKEELKELDKHARSLGIELVFSIQTLGHFEQFLRWLLQAAMQITLQYYFVRMKRYMNL